MIRTIYKKIIAEAKEEIRMKTEREILKIFEAEKDGMDWEADGEYQDKLYQALSIAEEGGFVMGFQYAVNLLMECAGERRHLSHLDSEK